MLLLSRRRAAVLALWVAPGRFDIKDPDEVIKVMYERAGDDK